MTEQSPRSAAADVVADQPPLRLAPPEARAHVAVCDHRIRAVLARGDHRDQAAERRDRHAEADEAAGRTHLAWIDRDWAGRDRDQAAVDRAALIDILQELALRTSADVPEPASSVIHLTAADVVLSLDE